MTYGPLYDSGAQFVVASRDSQISDMIPTSKGENIGTISESQRLQWSIRSLQQIARNLFFCGLFFGNSCFANARFNVNSRIDCIAFCFIKSSFVGANGGTSGLTSLFVPKVCRLQTLFDRFLVHVQIMSSNRNGRGESVDRMPFVVLPCQSCALQKVKNLHGSELRLHRMKNVVFAEFLFIYGTLWKA